MGDGEEGGGMREYLTASFVGIIVAICGNVVISFALNCQKLAHKRLAERKEPQSSPSQQLSGLGSGSGGGQRSGVNSDNRRNSVDHHRSPPNSLSRHTSASLLSGIATGESQPLLFKPNNPTRSYTDPIPTHSSPAPAVLFAVQPLSQFSPAPSPKRKHALSNSSKASSKISNGSAAVADIPEEEDESGRRMNRDRDRESSNGTIRPGQNQERAVSWTDAGQDGVPLKTASPGGATRFNGEGEETEYLKSRLWWIGLLLLNVGEFGNFLSYAFAPASVVAPLGSFALIANCFFAPIMLKERFRKQDILGVGITILGAVTVVSAAKSKEVRLDPEGLLEALKRLPFVIYASLNIITGCILAFLSERSAGQEFVVVDVGLCGIFGGFTVLCTKAISTLLSLRGFEILAEPITYPVIALLVATGLGQIKFLNRALMTFDSKIVIPTQFVLFTLAAIIGSAVLYRDFDDMTFHRFVVFIYGCLTTFLGVYLLTRGNISQESMDERDVEGVVLSASPRPSTPIRGAEHHLLYSFATTFTPLLTPRTIRIPDGQEHTLRGRRSRASLAAISPGYLLLAGTGSPGLEGSPALLAGDNLNGFGSRRRTRSESRTPLVSRSLEEEDGRLDGEMRDNNG